MNSNLLKVVQQITAQYGEDVLADAKRLKAFFGDLAKDEPKPLRMAFCRCIEEGAHGVLKGAPDAEERAGRKACAWIAEDSGTLPCCGTGIRRGA